MSATGTVLVVDDNPLVREMAKDIFQDLGCNVVDAYNAAGALAIATERLDIVLAFIDVRLPGEMDGVHLAEILQRMFPDARIVLTSGYSVGGLEGFEFVPKPWTEPQLAALLPADNHRAA